MKKIILLVLLFLSFTAFCQQKAIEITNIKTGKTIVYENSQRIKIRTLDGKKHVGELKVVDENTFLVGSETIQIDSLQSIKIQPKNLEQIKNIVLYTGLAIVVTGITLATLGNNAAFLAITVGTGVTIGAGIIEGINGNNSKRKWNFKIIEK